MATHADIALFSVAAATLYGALIGSFLNVVIYRLPRECMSLARPGSSCPRCGAKVRWYDNAPVVSFLLLGGRCRACRGPISWRYPFVEALTAILFGAVALKYAATPLLLSPPGEPNWARAAAYCALLAALVAAAGIDMALYILPDEITLGGLCLAPLAAFCFPEIMAHLMAPAGVGGVAPLAGRMGALLHSLFGAFVGGAILALVGAAGRLMFRKEAMGLGDIKLAAMIGAALGWRGVALTILVAVVAGAAVGVGILVARRLRGDRGSHIPFGLYLAIGAAAIVLAEERVLDLLAAYVRFAKGAGAG